MVASAAAEVGVSRQTVSNRLRKARAERDAEAERVAERSARGVGLLTVGGERRRIMPFWEFEERYFGHLICPDCGVRHEPPVFHREIIDAVESDARRVVVNIPPYHSKSTLVTVRHTLYEICRDPNSRTILVSKSAPMAKTFLQAIQSALVNHELYGGAGGDLIDDWGPFREDGAHSIWSSSQMYVAGRVTAEKDPTVRALGVGEQIYGARADVVKFDDIAVVENQTNPERVQAMLGWLDKEALSRVGKSGKAIWVGTRVMPGDVYSFLRERQSYRVVRYPVIVDEVERKTLWPEHFPWDQAMVHREEMKAADFQLVYQNVDMPGSGASFTAEMVESAKDTSRGVGMFDSSWRLIAGLDPAGGSKDSGFTAMSLVGVDLESGRRFLVDQLAVKSMKAPEMKNQILEWSDSYPISEWRVEVNGVQSQLIQYDRELVQRLAQRGVRVVPHTTNRNKWDPQFGVESMAPLFETGLVSIPWGNREAHMTFQPFVDELLSFPMGAVSDRVMSFWFTHIGARAVLDRPLLPMFDERMKVPARVKRRRRVVDFGGSGVSRVSLRDQRVGHVSRVGSRRRQTVGSAGSMSLMEFDEGDGEVKAVNTDLSVWDSGDG